MRSQIGCLASFGMNGGFCSPPTPFPLSPRGSYADGM